MSVKKHNNKCDICHKQLNGKPIEYDSARPRVKVMHAACVYKSLEEERARQQK